MDVLYTLHTKHNSLRLYKNDNDNDNENEACGSEAAINQAKPINQRPKGVINQRFLRD